MPVRLLFAEQLIDHPATADVFAAAAAVLQHVRVVAAGFFQGVGENGQPVEGPLLVDGLCQVRDGAVVPGQLGRLESRRLAKRVTEEVAEEGCLCGPLL